jgi:hypothetical protein
METGRLRKHPMSHLTGKKIVTPRLKGIPVIFVCGRNEWGEFLGNKKALLLNSANAEGEDHPYCLPLMSLQKALKAAT